MGADEQKAVIIGIKGAVHRRDDYQYQSRSAAAFEVVGKQPLVLSVLTAFEKCLR